MSVRSSDPSAPRDAPWPFPGPPAVQLVKLDAGAIDALAAGDGREANRSAPLELSDFFVTPGSSRTWAYRSRQLRDSPQDADWVTRVIVDADGQFPVGQSGYHGPPNAIGMVEIGYAVDTAYHRRGYARSAVGALLARASLEPTVHVVRATISPGNVASLNLIAQFGFVQNGEQEDEEDGLELIFERPA
jgi:[ribosomal protein S5]-alanine N-acetyltransferase